MKIAKGLITAAGDPQRRIPLQTLVDKDGVTRTILAMLVNEIFSAGIEEIGIVIPPGDSEAYRTAVPDHHGRLHFIVQPELLGYSNAILCARGFLGGAAFLHLVGDHVYLNNNGSSSAAQLVALAENRECSVSAVQPTHESLISRFGVVGGSPLADHHSLYKVESVVEKPTPTEAEQRLIVAGLRAGSYLAFFGMHVLTPRVLDIIDESGSVSAALDTLAGKDQYLAWQVSGRRYDLGPRYGLLNAQLALALSGRDRDEVLSSLLSLVSA